MSEVKAPELSKDVIVNAVQLVAAKTGRQATNINVSIAGGFLYYTFTEWDQDVQIKVKVQADFEYLIGPDYPCQSRVKLHATGVNLTIPGYPTIWLTPQDILTETGTVMPTDAEIDFTYQKENGGFYSMSIDYNDGTSEGPTRVEF